MFRQELKRNALHQSAFALTYIKAPGEIFGIHLLLKNGGYGVC